jgi:excisionase family DNA binding protein
LKILDAAMNDTNYSAWLTKQQAADAIGVSTKFIEQLAKEKKLQSAKRQRPETGAWVSVYHPDDVGRLRQERKPEALPFIMPAAETEARTELATAPAANPNAIAIRQSPAEFLQALFAALQTASENSENHSVRITERLFLTIPEAADYSGLPQAHLRRLVADGKLTGLKTGAGWRIRRADLEKL